MKRERLNKAERSALAHLWNGGQIYIYTRKSDQSKGYQYGDTLSPVSKATVESLFAKNLVREERQNVVLNQRPSALIFDMLRLLDQLRNGTLGRLHHPFDHTTVKAEAGCSRCKVRRQIENLLKEFPV